MKRQDNFFYTGSKPRNVVLGLGLGKLMRAMCIVPVVLLPCCTWFAGPETDYSPIVINEFMAKNTPENPLPIVDEYNEADDWVEMYNTADTAASLKGLYLSDNPSALRKFPLFDTVLPAHGFLLIWADGQPDQGKRHAHFKLSATNGDRIMLSNGKGRVVDEIDFLATSGNPQARLPNQSYGRTPDGINAWCQQITPTPALKNRGCVP
jgi:hypothetical protein